MAGELTRENAAALTTQLGRAPSAGELYAAHVLGSGGAARLIQAAQQGAANASALFPREASANRGIFYASGQACSAQDVLNRLNLDATASIGDTTSASAPTAPRTIYAHDGMMSPALANALFNMALLPLLSSGADGDDQRQNDPLAALSAYARSSQT
jgi:hypothetical protein